jgi:hypothetical protein
VLPDAVCDREAGHTAPDDRDVDRHGAALRSVRS